MKVQTITIGEYQISPAIPFNLYQFSSSLVTPPIHDQEAQEYSINYFCIEDLFAIFDLDLIKNDLIHTFKQYPGSYCKNGLNNLSYIQSQVIGDIALKHQLYNLADLCRLSVNDLLSGGAISLLKMTTFIRLINKPMKSIIDNFQTRQLEGNEWFFTSNQNSVKLEPFSPRLICLSSSSSSSSSVFIHTNQDTMIHEDIQSQEDNLINKLPKPSSLLLKRLAPKHGHKKNLTILTPSYNEDSPMNGIQSAPLRRTTTIPVFGNKHKVVKKSSPPNQINKKSRLFNNIPATASAISAPWPQTSAQTRFPSPPIVPSQQPSWAQYRQQQQQQQKGLKTGTFIPRTPTMTNTSPQPQPQPPTQAQHLTQKQKFLQPFEFLYDHIEQTRVLKTTLDDQIRRSSSLMQTLQSSGTMVESLVRRQVRDMMDEKFEAKIRDCTERINKLEYRCLPTSNTPISPAISPTKEQQQQKPLVVKDLLSQLMNRIDQLESKLEK